MLLAATATAKAQPNLTPYKPSGWSDKVVVTTSSSGTVDTTPLLATDTLYVDWCVINSGTANVTTTFEVDINVDGNLSQSWDVGALPVNNYEYVTGYPIGSLAAGTHTIEVVADATDAVPEDNESDNSYTKTITIGAVTLPAPTALAPADGAAGQPAVPYFVWSAVTNASSYRALIATNPSDLPTNSTATNGGASVVINAILPTTNFMPSVTLNPSTTYYWEVHGRTGGDNGAWSSIQQFTTQATPVGLTIVPTFDSSITSDPNAATIEATILAAISVYRSSFSDPVTANFTFEEMSAGLGENGAQELFVDYSDYLAALTSHATTADDATALAHLPAGPDNPVNGNPQMAIKFPLARALGFDTGPAGNDATVFLNTSIMNLSSLVTDPNKYSLFSTVSHEMDEALGFGSVLNGLSNGDAAPTDPAQPQDLFRYDGTGNRSLTTDLNATSYFSFDGTTDLAQFNQFDGGDFGDWYSFDAQVVPEVQDAFLNPGVNPVLGVELRGLDAIGFTRVMANSQPSAPQFGGARMSGGKFLFTLSGSANATYVIQKSSNLAAWLTVSTNTIPAGGSVSITNTVSAGQNLFYRAISQ